MSTLHSTSCIQEQIRAWVHNWTKIQWGTWYLLQIVSLFKYRQNHVIAVCESESTSKPIVIGKGEVRILCYLSDIGDNEQCLN